MKKNKNMWKRIGCGILAVISILSISNIEARAESYWPEGPSISTPSAIVMELNSGAVLYEKNSDEVNYPASITKIMTTMLALEYCELDEVVTFSADAVFKNEGNTSHIARDLNEEMTMEECLYAVMLESANECAYAVAEHVGAKLGGDYQTFVDLMNEKAKELGCKNTHFNNANGLPDTEHWTSARDMALISAEAYKNETFRIIIASKRYVIPPTNKHKDKTYLNNHHNMIHNYKTNEFLYEYCTGGKTGYTQAAKSTLVSFAEKDDITLVCVIMRNNGVSQYTETRSLFEYCFQNFMVYNILENESSLIDNHEYKGELNGYDSFVSIDKNASIVLPVTASLTDVKCSIIEKDGKGGVIAKLEYTYGDRTVGSADIFASGVSAGDNYLSDKLTQTDEENIIKIKPLYIILGLCSIIAVVIVIILGKKLYDNFYVILHDLEIRKQRRQRFRPIEKKRRKRGRRDRMFR